MAYDAQNVFPVQIAEDGEIVLVNKTAVTDSQLGFELEGPESDFYIPDQSSLTVDLVV